jgi:leader peptidase (prepilin peptidase)/N-methyltransferase
MNVLICRLPKGVSVVFPSSNCPNCGERIKFFDNIPVLSFIILGGRCRYCNEKISFRYPMVEMSTGIVFLFVSMKFYLQPELIKYLVFTFLLLAAAFTDMFTALDDDFECGIIPDEISLGGTVIGLAFAFFFYPGIFYSILGAVCGFLILWLPSFMYYVVTKKEGMGGGDLKLFAMIGAFLGIKPLFFILFFSSFFGVLVGLPLILVKKNRNFPIPFGPFISLATIFYIFYGDILVSIYLNKMFSGG